MVWRQRRCWVHGVVENTYTCPASFTKKVNSEYLSTQWVLIGLYLITVNLYSEKGHSGLKAGIRVYSSMGAIWYHRLNIRLVNPTILPFSSLLHIDIHPWFIQWFAYHISAPAWLISKCFSTITWKYMHAGVRAVWSIDGCCVCGGLLMFALKCIAFQL